MPHATLTLTIPDGVWIGDISRAYPDARVRILAAFPSEQSGVALTEIVASNVDDLLDEFAASEDVTEYDVLQQEGETVLLQFETTMPLLLMTARNAGIPLETPFDLQDGRIEWEVTASQHRLSELGSQLDAFGIPFTVTEVHQDVEAEQLLTDRQNHLLHAAVERGYYDTPRRCSLTELAGALDIAKSTASETLHRAEETVIKEFVDDLEDTTSLIQSA